MSLDLAKPLPEMVRNSHLARLFNRKLDLVLTNYVIANSLSC